MSERQSNHTPEDITAFPGDDLMHEFAPAKSQSWAFRFSFSSCPELGQWNRAITRVSSIFLRTIGNSRSQKAVAVQLLIRHRQWIQET